QAAVAMARAGVGGDQRRASGRERDQAEAIALPERKLDRARGDRLRGVELAPFGTRGVGLRHRCARVDDEPDRERALALGFAHEIAVGARIEFPVDAARLVAGLVRAVLRELEAGAAAPARVLAESVAAGAVARAKAKVFQSRADISRDQCDGGHVVTPDTALR